MTTRSRGGSSRQSSDPARQMSVAASSSSRTPKRFAPHLNVRKVLYRHTPAPSDLASTPAQEPDSSPLPSQESFITALGSDALPSSPLQRGNRTRLDRRLRNSLAQSSSPAAAPVDDDDDEDLVADDSGTYSEKQTRDNFAPESEPNADGFTYCLDLPEHWPEYLRYAPTNDPTPREITKVWDVFAKHFKWSAKTAKSNIRKRDYLLKMWGTWVKVEHAVQWLEEDGTFLVAVREFKHGVKVLIDWEMKWSNEVDHEVEQTWRTKPEPKLFIEDKGKGVTIRNKDRLTAMGRQKLIAQVYDLPEPTFDDFFNGQSDHGVDPNSDKEGASVSLGDNSVFRKKTFQAACDGLRAGARRQAARGKKRALPPKQAKEDDEFSELLGSPELGNILPTTERPMADELEEDRAPSPPMTSSSPAEDFDEYVESDDEPLVPPRTRQRNRRTLHPQPNSQEATQQDYDELKSPERKRGKNLAGERSDRSRSGTSNATPASAVSLPTRPRRTKETPVPLPPNLARAASYMASRGNSGKSKTPPSRAIISHSSPCARSAAMNAQTESALVKEELMQNTSSTWGQPPQNGQADAPWGQLAGGASANASSVVNLVSPTVISSSKAKGKAPVRTTMAQQQRGTLPVHTTVSNDFRTVIYPISSTKAGLVPQTTSNRNTSTTETPFARFEAKTASLYKSMLPTPTYIQHPMPNNVSTSASASTAGPLSAGPSNITTAPRRRSGMFQTTPRAPRATRPEGSGSYTTHQESIRALHARVPREQPVRSKLAAAKEALGRLSVQEQEQLIRDVRSASRDHGGLAGALVGEVEDDHVEEIGGERDEGVWGDDEEEEDPFAFLADMDDEGVDGDTDMRFG